MVQFYYVLYLPIYVLFCHFNLSLAQGQAMCITFFNSSQDMHSVRLKFHNHIIIHSSHFVSTGGAQRLQAQSFFTLIQVISDLTN